MLVLTRKLGESIRIGKDISITIVEVNNKYTKIGINAPKSVAVHREEIYEKILEENKAAAKENKKIDMSKMASFFKKK